MEDHQYGRSRPTGKSTTGAQCYAINCYNYRNKQSKSEGVSFHKFPDKVKKAELYQSWLRNCGRERTPTTSSLVCSEHFTDDMLDKTGQITRLREFAIPTIIAVPGHSKKDVKERRSEHFKRARESDIEPDLPSISEQTCSEQTYLYSDSGASIKLAGSANSRIGMELNNRLAKRYHGPPFCNNLFVEFNIMAAKYSEVNLGQGAPGSPPDKLVTDKLQEVASEVNNRFHQYAREQGHIRLVNALAKLYSPTFERELNPLEEIIVTAGAYESLTCSFLALVNPGDEVILIEPYFDQYLPLIKLSGGIPVFISLRPTPDNPSTSADWKLDRAELESKFNSNTRMIVLNTPHNPLGKVFNHNELQIIADLCVKHDVLCVSDEVYEWLVYPKNDTKHIRIANLPGMWERTITIGSAGKSLGITGWRVGWSIGVKHLIDCLMMSHQYGDLCVNSPCQEAVARCLEVITPSLGHPDCLFERQRSDLQERKDKLIAILRNVGFKPYVPEGGYFIVADWTGFVERSGMPLTAGNEDDFLDFKFTKTFLKEFHITSIPPSAFFHDNKEIAKHLVRFCFFRSLEVIDKFEKIVLSMLSKK